MLFLGTVFAQTQLAPNYNGSAQHQISSKRYFTDEYGNILMNVNVWGHVNKPGRHVVYEGIDLATLLSMVGGPKTGANLKKIRLFREAEDENGNFTYEINMERFLKTGNREGFVKIMPNDTFVVPQTFTSLVFAEMRTVNTFMSMLNLYFTMQYYRERLK